MKQDDDFLKWSELKKAIPTAIIGAAAFFAFVYAFCAVMGVIGTIMR